MKLLSAFSFAQRALRISANPLCPPRPKKSPIPKNFLTLLTHPKTAFQQRKMDIQINEVELLKRLKQSDERAFYQLFRGYYKYLVVIAYQYIKDDHLSKDFGQEVCMDLWRLREEINIDFSLKYFLRRAVINRCLATGKKNSRMSYKEDAGSDLATAFNETEEAFQMKELNEILEEAYAQLPERCRLIFKMSRQENLSHKEIAAKLDISTKTIENQITKALKIIREALKKYGVVGFFL